MLFYSKIVTVAVVYLVPIYSLYDEHFTLIFTLKWSLTSFSIDYKKILVYFGRLGILHGYLRIRDGFRRSLGHGALKQSAE